MEPLKQELERWLREQFPQSDPHLEYRPASGKIGGFLVWGGFAGEEPIDRQGRLWRAIRAHFSRDDQLRLSLIVTLTPAEYAATREPQAA